MRVVPCTKVHITFTKTAGSLVVDLTEWDVKKAIQSVLKSGTSWLYLKVKIDNEVCTCDLAFEESDAQMPLVEALNGRTVPIGRARVKVAVQCVRESTTQESWKGHFFGKECDASLAVQEELFKRAEPGKRPDTIIIKDVPCKCFDVSPLFLEDEEEDEAGEEGEVSQLDQAREALTVKMQAIGGWVVQADADIKDLRCDIYVQYRKLSDVLHALSRLHARALRHGENLVVPLTTEVDKSGYFTPANVAGRKERAVREIERKKMHLRRSSALKQERRQMVAELESMRRKTTREGVMERVKFAWEDVNMLMEKSARWEELASVTDPEGAEALAQLSQLLELLRRRLGKTGEAISSAIMAEEEKARLERVKEIRIQAAKRLKQLDIQWRGLLNGEYGKAADSEACQAPIAKVNQVLTTARDLILKSAADIRDVKRYAQHVDEALQQADERALVALAKLKTEWRMVPLLERWEVLRGEIEREEGPGIEAREAWGSLSESDSDDEAGAAKKKIQGLGRGAWHWPFPERLTGAADVTQSMAVAQSAAQQLTESRGKDDVTTGELVVKALDSLEHEVDRLSWHWRRHKAVLPWTRRYDEVWDAERRMALEEDSILTPISQAAEQAIARCRKCVVADGEEWERLVETMQRAVERAEKALGNEERRKVQEAEERRQRRKAKEEMRRERRERKEVRRLEINRMEKERTLVLESQRSEARLKELKRRKAFLQQTMKLKLARQRLQELSQSFSEANPPPLSRLLQAGGLDLNGNANCHQHELDDEEPMGQEQDAIIARAVSRNGSCVIVPLDPVQEQQRWQMACNCPPEILQLCAQNQVSQSEWPLPQGEVSGKAYQLQSVVHVPSRRKRPRVMPTVEERGERRPRRQSSEKTKSGKLQAATIARSQVVQIQPTSDTEMTTDHEAATPEEKLTAEEREKRLRAQLLQHFQHVVV